ncbi:unnamed protein product [Diamesa serratosioi]
MATVVLFKAESIDNSDKYVELLEKHFKVIAIPTLDFVYKNLTELKEKLKNANDYSGIIFTSPRSINAIVKSLRDEKLPAEWSLLKNYSVGESTYNLAQSLLHLKTHGKEAGNAKDLANIIVKDNEEVVKENPFLFPSGNLKQDILEKSLNAHNIKVTPIEIYETIAHLSLKTSINNLKDNNVDYIVYFSPSGLKFTLPILMDCNFDFNSLKLIALGPSSKKAIEEQDLKCYKMCEKPTPESLLETLLD